MTHDDEALAALRQWRNEHPHVRPKLLAAAWNTGITNVRALAEAAGISRDTVYSDLRAQGIDITDRRTRVDQAKAGTSRVADVEYWSDAYANELIADSAAATTVLINLKAGTNQGAKRVQLEKAMPHDMPAEVGPDPALIQGTADLRGGYFNPDGLWAWRGWSNTDTGRVGWCLLGPAYNAGPDVNFVADLMAGRGNERFPRRVVMRTVEASRLQRLLAIEHPAARKAAIKALGRDDLAAELRDAVDAYRLDGIGGDRPARFAAAIYTSLEGGRFAGVDVEAVYIGAPIWVYRQTPKVGESISTLSAQLDHSGPDTSDQ